jgi:hypothetical protein
MFHGPAGSFRAAITRTHHARDQLFGACLIHDDRHEVHFSITDSKVEAASFLAIGGRSRPSCALGLPIVDQTLNDDDAVGIELKVMRESIVCWCHDLFHNCFDF